MTWRASRSMYDVAVIGLGPVGSAALRYLAQELKSVVGIGPAEPVDWSSHAGPFASHYDSGRITRRLDARLEWAVLASRSIEQYGALEEAAQLTFHRPVGLVFVRRDGDGIAHQHAVIDRLRLPVTVTASDRLPSTAVGYDLPAGWTVLHEPAPAGFIDPRLMVRAQLKLAAMGGAEVRRTWVSRVTRRRTAGVRIECEDGSTVEAARVLVAAGAYTGHLLPRPLAASVAPEAVVLARVTPEVARELAELPSLIYLLDHPRLDDIYVVPPVRYPDGTFYVKMGGSNAAAEPLATPDAMRMWMAGAGADDQLADMRDVVRSLLPGVEFESFSMKPCLITDTAHGLPFIDQVDDDVFVAAGGNGHAAKSADAIGALGAHLVGTGRWGDSELHHAAFAAVLGDYRPGDGSRHGN